MECVAIKNGKPMMGRLAVLYRNKKYCDITVKCSDGSIQAHSLVLQMSSPIWAEAIEQIQCSGNRELSHINISRESMECILEIIYLGFKHVPKRLLPEVTEAFQLLKVEGFTNEESVKELLPTRGTVPDSEPDTTLDEMVPLELTQEQVQNNSDFTGPTCTHGNASRKRTEDSTEPSSSNFGESNVSPEAIPKKKAKARKFIFPPSADRDSRETVAALKENNLKRIASFIFSDVKKTCVICYMDFDDFLAHFRMHCPILRKKYECKKCSKKFYTPSFHHICGKKE